jgi:hypothetical protein
VRDLQDGRNPRRHGDGHPAEGGNDRSGERRARGGGEYYLDEGVAHKVYAQAEEAVRRHAEVEIVRYAA